MKTQLLSTALLCALGGTLTACGNGSGSNNDSAIKAQTASEKELTGEPKSAEEMANQNYRLKTDGQDFLLKNLGHMVWAKFECKIEVPEEGQKPSIGTATISFYPSFDIKVNTGKSDKIVVSQDQACGRRLPNHEQPVIPSGSLSKNENNQYVISYGLSENEPLLQATWDAAGTAQGEITCYEEKGNISKAALSECKIIPVP